MEEKIEFEIDDYKVIKFDYPGGVRDKLDKLNYQMSFIVNRAAAFNRAKFDRIVVRNLPQGHKGYIFYRAILTIAMVKNIRIIFHKDVQKIDWVDLTNLYSYFLGERKFNKTAQLKGGLEFDWSCEDDPKTLQVNPRIFSGFDNDMLVEIANKLYEYEVKETDE